MQQTFTYENNFKIRAISMSFRLTCLAIASSIFNTTGYFVLYIQSDFNSCFTLKQEVYKVQELCNHCLTSQNVHFHFLVANVQRSASITVVILGFYALHLQVNLQAQFQLPSGKYFCHFHLEMSQIFLVLGNSGILMSIIK